MPSKRYGAVCARLVVQAEDGQKIEVMQRLDHVFAGPWNFIQAGKSENRTRSENHTIARVSTEHEDSEK